MQILKYINNIGEVIFKKERRFKSLSLRLHNSGQITVCMPYLFSFDKAESWLIDNSQWIDKARARIEEKMPLQTKFYIGSSYKTYKHELTIVEGESFKKDNLIALGLPNSIIHRINDVDIQDAIRKLIVDIYFKESKEVLPIRICELADLHKFSFNKLSIRNNKSRWGSCSSDRNISLNIHLMRLPDELIDYVILHELCHTFEMNHSPAFWNLLESVCINCKDKRKALREYSTSVF